MFQNYMLASNGASLPDARRKAVLLHSLGPEAQNIFYTLTPRDDTYEAAIEALTARFKTAVNVSAERYRFRSRAHAPGETIDQYVSVLRELSCDCNFGAGLEDALRDQLIEKTVEPKVREQLLLHPNADNLTLEEAITTAKRVETALREARSLQAVPTVAPAEVNRIRGQPFQPSGGKRHYHTYKKVAHAGSGAQGTGNGSGCYRCGDDRHRANYPQCPAKNKTCNNCSKKGHFAKVCKSASIGTKSRSFGTPAAVRNVTTGSAMAEALSELTVLSVDAQHELSFNHTCKRLTCELLLADQPVGFQVDTGSPVSIVNVKALQKIEHKLEPVDTVLRTYNQSSIQVRGVVHLPVSFRGRSAMAKFYVVDSGESLVGLRLMSQLHMVIAPKSTPLPCNPGANCTSTEPVVVNRIASFDVMRTEFPKVFNGLGKAERFMHRSIEVDDALPVAQKARPVPLALQEELRSEIDHLLDQGIIQKVEHADWVSPVVLGRRKNGRLRMCLDLRTVTKNIHPVRYPLPNMETLFASLREPKFITKLDLNSAYHQLPLHPDTAKLCCFATPTGLYQFQRGPIGLADLPGSFQRMMDLVLAGCEGVFCFLDDLLIVGATEAEHDENLRNALSCLGKNGLTLSPSKCLFKVQRLEWLGFNISADGLEMTSENICAVTRLKIPTTVKDVQRVLGLFSHYSRFIHNFAEKSEPLRRITHKDAPWEWGNEQDNAFQALQHAVTAAPVLALYQLHLPIVVTCDASDYALGAELAQLQPDGELRPVAFASKLLTPCERNYSVGEKEALACVWSVKKWDRYLRGQRFKLRTDHSSLLTLLPSPDTTGHKPARIARWATTLLDYNFTMEFKKGSTNVVADALSRLPTENVETIGFDMDFDEDEFVQQMVHSIDAVSITTLAEETRRDPVLSQVLEYLETRWPKKTKLPQELVPYYNVRDKLFIFQTSCIGRGEQAVIPKSLQHSVLMLAHEGHVGIVKSKQTLRHAAYWPGADKAVEDYVQNCHSCATSDKSAKLSKAPLQPRKPPGHPWEELAIDIQGPFESAPPNCRYLINLTDYYSKWPESAATSTITARRVVEFLTSRFAIWGVPKSLTSDNGTQFVSAEFAAFLESNGIQHIRTPNYHPMANGAVERLNGTIKTLLQTNIKDSDSWFSALHSVLVAIRSTPHSATNFSPHFLMTNREMPTKLTKLKPETDIAPANCQAYERMCQRQNQMKESYDRKHGVKEHSIQEGERVRVKLGQPAGSKLRSHFSEPLEVVAVKGNILTLSDAWKWHVNRCVKVKSSEATTTDFQVTATTKPRLPLRLSSTIANERPKRNLKRPGYLDNYVY